MKNTVLIFEQKVKVPPDAVYYAFTNRTAIREWLCDGVESDPREGGRLYFWWNTGFTMSGTFTKLEENHVVECTWNGSTDPGPTAVSVALAPEGDGTLVTLTHGGLGSGKAWEAAPEEITKRWNEALENLASVLETGVDLRIARRPTLGVFSGELISEEDAEKRGLPRGANGFIPDNVQPGTGTEAAGIRAGDVIHSIDQVVLNSGSVLRRALMGKRVGDVVEVVYWHDGKQIKTHMTLSARPMPQVPGSPKELAKALQTDADQMGAELAKILDGVSEEKASHRPAEGEWSAKEVMAHLILSERTWMMFVNPLANGTEPRDFPVDNLQAHIDALLATYPTLDALRAELRRIRAELIALVANLPEAFAKRKGSYLRMGEILLQTYLHTRAHYEQMRKAIESAG